jgi:branched-chain amino acid transport system permease protein
VQVVLEGLAQGSIYGLIALGMSIMFYVTRVINFAQGQVAMVAVMVTAALAAGSVPIGFAIVLGIGASIVIGVLTYLVAVRPVIVFDRFSFAWLASTLGVALILENGAAAIWGTSTKPFPALLNNHIVHLLGTTITTQQLLAILVGLGLAIGFELIRRHTLMGKVGMAVAFDPEIASTVGANSFAYSVGAFAVAALLAGVAGVLIGPTSFANPYLGSTYGISAFVGLMLAGTQRPMTALFGGMILGVLNELANTEINRQASTWFPFVVVLIVLLLIPDGLFSDRNPLWKWLGGLGRRRGGGGASAARAEGAAQ